MHYISEIDVNIFGSHCSTGMFYVMNAVWSLLLYNKTLLWCLMVHVIADLLLQSALKTTRVVTNQWSVSLLVN